jgi:hypothetical protein
MFIVATSRNLAGNQSPPTDPCHRDDAVLEQLALRLEHRPCELGQLVEKRDTAMPECAGMSPERSQPVVGAVRCLSTVNDPAESAAHANVSYRNRGLRRLATRAVPGLRPTAEPSPLMLP